MGIYQSFSGLPSYFKNFYLNWCCSNFQQISKENQINFQQVSKVLSVYAYLWGGVGWGSEGWLACILSELADFFKYIKYPYKTHRRQNHLFKFILRCE